MSTRTEATKLWEDTDISNMTKQEFTALAAAVYDEALSEDGGNEVIIVAANHKTKGVSQMCNATGATTLSAAYHLLSQAPDHYVDAIYTKLLLDREEDDDDEEQSFAKMLTKGTATKGGSRVH